MFPILQGIVGSTAYGLAGPDSDIDTLGVFAHPTEAFFGLDQPEETIKASKDDTMHEAAKYCKLALNGNPTVMELLWLPEELYTARSYWGDQLIEIRGCFLSAPRVRNAYLGYASQQFDSLKARGGTFSSDTSKRTAKHARHLFRLLEQGTHLYVTGRLKIRVADPEYCRWFGERVAEGNTLYAEKALNDAKLRFDSVPSALPEKPYKEPVEAWLKSVRRIYLDRPKTTE